MLLAGLIAQTVSYLFFTLLVSFSNWRIVKSTLDTTVFPWFLFSVIYFSSVFILVSTFLQPLSQTYPNMFHLQLRGCFRIAIFSGGKGSYLDTHECEDHGFLQLMQTLTPCQIFSTSWTLCPSSSQLPFMLFGGLEVTLTDFL